MKSLICLGALFLVVASAAGCSSNNGTTTPSTTTPTTLIFNSALAVGGSASRSFSMTTAGTVTVTLTSFGAGGQAAGLGIGVPTPTVGAPCALTQSVVTLAGGSPQLVTTADAGTYCVQIYDIGNLPSDTGFSISIVTP